MLRLLTPRSRPHRSPLAEVARSLAEATGLSFVDGLDGTLAHGLARAASALGAEPAALARRVVAREPAALAALVDHAVVAEAPLWRHPEALAAAARFFARRRGPLAIWSAACGGGEEPYGLAIALLEGGRAGAGDRILATDLSERALAAARAARYGPRALGGLPPAVAARWLEGEGEARTLAAAVRAPVTFARHNLATERAPAGGPFDLVLCRDVLATFEPRVAAAALYRLADALRPGGVLVLAPGELQLAAPMALDWFEDGGVTLLVRT